MNNYRVMKHIRMIMYLRQSKGPNKFGNHPFEQDRTSFNTFIVLFLSLGVCFLCLSHSALGVSVIFDVVFPG